MPRSHSVCHAMRPLWTASGSTGTKTLFNQGILGVVLFVVPTTTRVLASSTWVLRQQTDGAPHDWQDINIMSLHSNSLVVTTGMELFTVMGRQRLDLGVRHAVCAKTPGVPLTR